MADAAGIYELLWRPAYSFTEITAETISQLEAGYNALLADPDKFREYDAENGWGTYEHFVPFVKEVLDAVRECPGGWMYRSV